MPESYSQAHVVFNTGYEVTVAIPRNDWNLYTAWKEYVWNGKVIYWSGEETKQDGSVQYHHLHFPSITRITFSA